MNTSSRLLGLAGAAVAGPSFLLNVYFHDGIMPGPDEVDRMDGWFSLMFMAGAALCVAALLVARPAPLGPRGRWFLYVEAAMVALGAMWSAFIIADPANIDSTNPLILVGDACWPLHQVFMLFVGIAVVRAGRWPSPLRYAAFGPVFGIVALGVGATAGVDYLAAAGIGSGWAIVGLAIAAAPVLARRGRAVAVAAIVASA
jgi:hypothetical protein